MPSLRTVTTTLTYRSSKLSQTLPHSPIPILAMETRTPSPKPMSTSNNHTTGRTSPPPPPPLVWLWTCHLCKRTYPLGATRRCLEDGHFFCAGVTEVRRPTPRELKAAGGGLVVRRHAPCASEFDYAGWKRWGEWRRWRLGMPPAPQDQQQQPQHPWGGDEGGDGGGHVARGGCGAYCDFPSECRWREQALSPASPRLASGAWLS
jgi:hypothetical protein